ncbi:hypothetical protein Patl1_17649 [Pistacia atlantica]|uniref:Uncharacterized protein n=1 Tax=Pistacia atlantica TaxID=434234 RepID=A0ACC1BXU4_9ROSI|nr:hypothetical protein Patl1_17649 [Pistacia atlantica]
MGKNTGTSQPVGHILLAITESVHGISWRDICRGAGERKGTTLRHLNGWTLLDSSFIQRTMEWGICMSRAMEVEKKNYTTEKEYFGKAADNEEASGHYNLGVMYLKRDWSEEM